MEKKYSFYPFFPPIFHNWTAPGRPRKKKKKKKKKKKWGGEGEGYFIVQNFQ